MEEKPVKGRRVADICGERFGMLTAIAPTEKRDAKRFVIWHCKCDCGNITVVGQTLMSPRILCR